MCGFSCHNSRSGGLVRLSKQHCILPQMGESCLSSLSAQSCLTLCDPVDCGPPFSVHGISQARILEWVAISFPRESSWPRDWTCISWVSCTGSWILYHWATWEAAEQRGNKMGEWMFGDCIDVAREMGRCLTADVWASGQKQRKQ